MSDSSEPVIYQGVDYHESFFDDFFAAFPDIQIEIVQQVAEDDRVASVRG